MDIGKYDYNFKYSEIEDVWHIIMALSNSTFSLIETSVGSKGIYCLSSEAMMSAMNTIITIDFCCNRSAYADAYTLIRKYRDDLMQYLFILNIIKNIRGIFEEELEDMSLDEDGLLKIIEMDFKILVSGERKNDAELAMESWIYNELEAIDNSKVRKQFFDTSRYKQYLMSTNSSIEYVMTNFLNAKWKAEDRKLNNYVHTNGLKYLTDNYVYQQKKEQRDKELIETLQNITDVILSLLALTDSIKMQSSDYLDDMEVGMRPREGSQYWVSPCIVEYMNTRFDEQLILYIQENEKNGMKFMTKDYE